MNPKVIGIVALSAVTLSIVGYVALGDDTPVPKLAAVTTTSSIPPNKAIPTVVPTQPTAVVVPPTTAKISARLTVTGAASFIDEYDVEPSSRVPNVATCAELAASGTADAEYLVPFPDESSSMKGGHRLTERVTFTPYTGPAVYKSNTLDPTSFLVLDRPVGDTSNIGFFPDTNPNATLTIKADNSGSFEFSDWKNPEGKSLSGKLEWTCTEAITPVDESTTAAP